jgi:hypothetical protein
MDGPAHPKPTSDPACRQFPIWWEPANLGAGRSADVPLSTAVQAAVTGVRPPTLQDTACAAPAPPGAAQRRAVLPTAARVAAPTMGQGARTAADTSGQRGSPTFRAAQASVRSRRCIRYGKRLAELAATSGGWVLALCWRAAGAAIPACRGARVVRGAGVILLEARQTLASPTRAVEATSTLQQAEPDQASTLRRANRWGGSDPVHPITGSTIGPYRRPERRPTRRTRR